MQVGPVRCQAFDRDEFFAIERRQKLNTGIDRTDCQVIAFAIYLGDDNCACAAVAFSTPFFGAFEAQVLAKKLQYGTCRINVFYFDDLTVQHEPDCICIRHTDQLPLYVE